MTLTMSPQQRLTTPTASPDVPGPPAEPLMNSSSPIHPQTKTSAASNGDSKVSSPSDSQVDMRERDRHDMFNLIALPILLLTAMANWDMGLWIREGKTLQESWHDTYIWELIGAIMLYFIADLLWVSVIPSCVKSPGVIVKVG